MNYMRDQLAHLRAKLSASEAEVARLRDRVAEEEKRAAEWMETADRRLRENIRLVELTQRKRDETTRLSGELHTMQLTSEHATVRAARLEEEVARLRQEVEDARTDAFLAQGMSAEGARRAAVEFIKAKEGKT